MFELLVFIFLIIVIVLAVKANENSKKIKELEINLFKLQKTILSLQRKYEGEEAQEPSPQIIKTEKPQEAEQPKDEEKPGQFFNPILSRSKSIKPSRTKAEWESLIGGKILNRIGAIALIIGIGFFLKYAFDNNWITETMRVLIGFVSGSLLLFLGSRFYRKEFQVFAQGLTGAGIAVLYLSVYSSFNFYNLVPQWIAFLMMSVVTVITFFHAIKYDSAAVSLLGWAGGFLTPFLLTTGIPNPAGLFIYLIILNLGLLLILIAKKEWYIIEPLSLIATYIIYFAWFDQYFKSADFYTAIFALIGLWLLFFISSYLQNQSGVWGVIKKIIPILNIGLFFSAVFILIESSYPEYDSLAVFIISWIYFVAAYSSRGKNLQYFFRQNLVTGFVLLFIATELQFSGFAGVIFWAAETFALYLFLKKIYEKDLNILLYLAALAVAANLISTEKVFIFYPVKNFVPVFSMRTIAYLAAAGAAGLISFFPLSSNKLSDKLIETFKYIFCFILFAWVTVEINDGFRTLLGQSASSDRYIIFLRILFLSLGWMVYSLMLVYAGKKLNEKALIYFASVPIIFSILFSVRAIEFYPLSKLVMIFNLRVLILLIITGLLIVVYLLSTKNIPQKFSRIFLTSIRISIVFVLLILITGETRDYFMKAMPGASESSLNRLENLKQLSLSGVWLIYSILLMAAGLWKRMQGLRIISIILFGFTILKIFIYDLSFLETLYRIFSFIGLGVILLIVSYLYQKFKDVIFN